MSEPGESYDDLQRQASEILQRMGALNRDKTRRFIMNTAPNLLPAAESKDVFQRTAALARADKESAAAIEGQAGAAAGIGESALFQRRAAAQAKAEKPKVTAPEKKAEPKKAAPAKGEIKFTGGKIPKGKFEHLLGGGKKPAGPDSPRSPRT